MQISFPIMQVYNIHIITSYWIQVYDHGSKFMTIFNPFRLKNIFNLDAIYSFTFWTPKSKTIYTSFHWHTPTLHNHAKHQTSSLYNAEEHHSTCTTVQLLNYTKPTYSCSTKFRLAMTAYDYTYIMILCTQVCIKSDSLHSCYPSTW
jgi:hypothetical protein